MVGQFLKIKQDMNEKMNYMAREMEQLKDEEVKSNQLLY